MKTVISLRQQIKICCLECHSNQQPSTFRSNPLPTEAAQLAVQIQAHTLINKANRTHMWFKGKAGVINSTKMYKSQLS